MEEDQNSARRAERFTALKKLRSSMKGRPDLEFPEERAVRINRFLALAGFGSRRAVEEEFILKGRVRIGRQTATLDTRVGSGDLVFVDGKLVLPPRAALYIALNKPSGFLVSRRPQGGAPTIYDLLPENLHDLKYAGRLDRFSRGLLLLSQDGHFIQAITHPTFRLTKKYRVRLDRLPEENFSRLFERGITDEGEELRAIRATVTDRKKKIVEVVLGQGKKRQIRRMFEAVGARVLDLYRVSIGELDLEKIQLAEGKFMAIEPDSIFSGTSEKNFSGFKNLSAASDESGPSQAG